MKGTVALPGPPGLKNSEPIRSRGRLARCRATARWVWRPSGRVQSSGTRTRAHCVRSPQGFQAIRPREAEPVDAVAVEPAIAHRAHSHIESPTLLGATANSRCADRAMRHTTAGERLTMHLTSGARRPS